MTGIYQILNVSNGKRYVGSTGQEFYQRWNEHRYRLRGGKHPNTHLQNAWNKYGEKAFRFLKIRECEEDQLLAEEQWFLDNWKPEYNKTSAANPGFRGRKHTEEAKKKIGDSLRGRKHHSEEWKEKLREKMKGNTYWVGREHTEEHKKRMSNRMRGENAAASKVTEPEVVAIRDLYDTGDFYLKDLATTFGISRTQVGAIVNRRAWSHI